MRAARFGSVATLAWLFALALTIAPSAQAPANDEEFDKLMKSVGATSGSLRKNMQGQNAAGVAADAKQMVDLQRRNAAFWSSRNAQDAVEWANLVIEHATEVDRAAAVNDLPGAAEHVKLMMSGCQQCHAKYREKGPDGFTIKKP